MEILSLINTMYSYYSSSSFGASVGGVIVAIIGGIVAIIFGVIKSATKEHDNYIPRKVVPKTQPVAAPRTSQPGLDTETRAVANYLNGLIAPDEYLFIGVTLPNKENEEPINIEYVVVSRKGIFSIDGNYWRGNIVGTVNSEYWKVRNGGLSYSYKNPFQKNEKAGLELAKLLGFKFDIKNAVIFNKFDTNTPVADIAFDMETFAVHYQNMPKEIDYEDVRKAAEMIRAKTTIKQDPKKAK